MPGDLFDELASQLREETRERLRIVRAFVEDETKRDAPVISGDLRDSIEMDEFDEFGDVFVSTIRATAPQATYTNEGTGVYAGQGRIYPVHARALAFFWYKIGRYMVLQSVAGQPGQHWWDGMDGLRMDERVDDGLEAAFGS